MKQAIISFVILSITIILFTIIYKTIDKSNETFQISNIVQVVSNLKEALRFFQTRVVTMKQSTLTNDLNNKISLLIGKIDQFVHLYERSKTYNFQINETILNNQYIDRLIQDINMLDYKNPGNDWKLREIVRKIDTITSNINALTSEIDSKIKTNKETQDNAKSISNELERSLEMLVNDIQRFKPLIVRNTEVIGNRRENVSEIQRNINNVASQIRDIQRVMEK